MLNIHEVRVTQNFDVIYPICKREKIDFFLMLDVIKLLQSTLDKNEEFFDKRIVVSKIEDKKRLKHLMENKGHLLLEIDKNAFAVKSHTYFWLKEIYENQIKADRKEKQFKIGKNIGIKRFT